MDILGYSIPALYKIGFVSSVHGQPNLSTGGGGSWDNKLINLNKFL